MSEGQGTERVLVADGPIAAADEVAANEPRGIGGWLLIVAVGQVIGPLGLLVTLGQTFFDPDALKGFEQFPLASYGELAFHLALMLLAIPTAVMFFRKSRYFPRVFICQLVAAFVIPALSVVWTALTLSAQLGGSVGEFLVLEPQEKTQFMLTIVAALIWIPYTLKSRRVRNTFGRQDDVREPETRTDNSPVARTVLLQTIVYIVAAIGASSLLVGLSHAVGRGVFSSQLLSGALQIALAIWLLRGSDVARVILALLYFLGFVFALGLPMLAGEREPLLIFLAVALAAVTGVCFWILAFSRRLRAELAINQARYRRPEADDA
jgi:hypothetical protein